jgi:diguanylate cyclase (GGDEF)-like protein
MRINRLLWHPAIRDRIRHRYKTADRPTLLAKRYLLRSDNFLRCFLIGVLLSIVILIMQRQLAHTVQVTLLFVLPIWFVASNLGFRPAILLAVGTVFTSAATNGTGENLSFANLVQAILALLVLILISYLVSKLKSDMISSQVAAVTDKLTQLPNRAGFELFGGKAFSQAKKHGFNMSLVMIDCDRFKEINDVFGHAAGDTVLKILADVLEKETREDDLLFRLGGDEFCIILAEINMKNSESIMRRIEDRFRRGVHEVGYDTSLSVGLVTLSESTESLEEWLALADESMYRRKDEKRQSVIAQLWR